MLLILTISIGALVGLAIVVAAVGALLPRAHVASHAIRLHRTPLEVWNAIHDIDEFVSWRPGLKRVEILPEAEGRARWKEEGANGVIVFERVEAHPPARLVTRIADPKLPFGGTWTYRIAPSAEGCVVTITEQGEVYNPIFRFMSRFVFGQTATMDEYLKGLGKRFGEAATPTEA